jgi:WD40 repeat protein
LELSYRETLLLYQSLSRVLRRLQHSGSIVSRSLTSSLSVEGASDPAQSKRPTAKHQFEIDHGLNFQSFIFLHDNVHIVSGSRFGAIYKWNCETGLLVGEPWIREGVGECVLVLSPDGKTIACGRNDGSIQRWNKDGKMIQGIWAAQSSAVLSLSWSPRGNDIAYLPRDGKILILKVENGEIKEGPIVLEGSYGMDSVAYSPSGDRIASGGQYTSTRIWDSSTGKLLVGPIKDLGEVVGSNSLVWSSDSSNLQTVLHLRVRILCHGTCFRQHLRHITPSLRA